MERTYVKKRRDFGRRCFFKLTDVEQLVDLKPNESQMGKYIQQIPSSVGVQCSLFFSEQRTNTETIELKEQGMTHLEGGWPKDVDITENESKKRYIKKQENNEKYVRAVKTLSEPLEYFLKQNISLDLYGNYFDEVQSEYFQSEVAEARMISVFKDPVTSFKRTVVDMSWLPADGKKVAIAYGVLQFQKAPQTISADSFIWDISNPNIPESKLCPSSLLCCLEYNPKESFTIVGGCYNGIISLFDTRKGHNPVLTSPIKQSHKDPVYDIKWMQTKSATQCLSVSTDGQAMFWDTRNLSEPKEMYNLQIPVEKLEGTTYTGILGGECIDYDTAYPTKFMVGTEQGTIISCQRRKNKPIQIDKAYFRHHGPVRAVQRNPQVNKFFLSVGDWTAKIWHEELSNPIITTQYHSTYLTDGCWSPSRPGVFFTTKADGSLDIWDLSNKQSKPTLTVNVSDCELHCIRVREGRHLMVGTTDGSASLIELSDGLSGYSGEEKASNSEEKALVNAILERETKRERNLIESKKAEQHGKKRESEVKSHGVALDEAELKEIVDYFNTQISQ